MIEVHGFGPYSLPRSSFWSIPTIKNQDFADIPSQLRSGAKKFNFWRLSSTFDRLNQARFIPHGNRTTGTAITAMNPARRHIQRTCNLTPPARKFTKIFESL
jgi:hypothetical protein